MRRDESLQTVGREPDELDEVCRLIAVGQPIDDPELLNRIRARSEAARRAIFEEHGPVEWAVEMIREARDEE